VDFDVGPGRTPIEEIHFVSIERWTAGEVKVCGRSTFSASLAIGRHRFNVLAESQTSLAVRGGLGSSRRLKHVGNIV
jgi:hypothetical protein